MNMSESIKALCAALVKAQTALEGVAKDKDNPFFKSKYADLSSVVGALKEPLTTNGLGYTQVLHDAENAAKVETIILHESGEWMSCGVISVPVSKKDAQGYGSALTYARRYSLSAAFGVAPEDDDGNAAAKAAPTAGALGSLSAKAQKVVIDTAKEVKALLKDDNHADAYAMWQNSRFSSDEHVAFWSLLDSKQRSMLDRMAQAEKDSDPTRDIPQSGPVITPAAHKRLEARIKELGADRDKLKAYVQGHFGIAHLNELTKSAYEAVDKMLDAKERQAAKAATADVDPILTRVNACTALDALEVIADAFSDDEAVKYLKAYTAKKGELLDNGENA